jgi:YebC/PmpR family DNA-binding regulatory protein
VAGHSKWANIQHRKGRQDEKRGKVWTRVIREIMVAARLGGGDLDTNPRLRMAVEKAKSVNLPADTVKRNIDKATGNLEGVNYEEIRYEGYGIGGVAVMVDTMTDNKVRTVAEVRHALNKHGGNLGTEGSVAFQFKHCGQLLLAPGTSEDAVMEAALDAGADDVVDNGDTLDIYTEFKQLITVRTKLIAAKLTVTSVEKTLRPKTLMQSEATEALKALKLIDKLDDIDDVQKVYSNLDITDELAEQFSNS